MKQRTEEWFADKRGNVGGSRVFDILPGAKWPYTAARKNYMAELVCERLTGKTQEMFVSTAMQWGTDTEPEARMEYEARNVVLVEEVGFIRHPKIRNFGASPDGLVGDKGVVEFKCPNTATHIARLMEEKTDFEYVIQMNAEMMCTGRDWCHYVDFDPRLPPGLSYLQLTFERSDKIVNMIEYEVEKFLNELDLLEAMLRDKMSEGGAM